MHTKRDRFLTEATGECWHKFGPAEDFNDDSGEYGFTCVKCGGQYLARKETVDGYRFFTYDEPPTGGFNFSTWKGFGKLWEWVQQQEWWKAFVAKEGVYSPEMSYCKGEHFWFESSLINPDKFAETVYNFLKRYDP